VLYFRAAYSKSINLEAPLIKKLLLLGTMVGMLCLTVAQAQQKARASSPALVARGKYLVDAIGMCSDCHTPRNEKGEHITEKYLQGMVLDFKPTGPIPVWADKSPNIAGLPGWENPAAIKFLMTGIAYNELPARPPMPQYRFNRADAEAIVAYLRSLGDKK
jgi:hypothetical protein